MSRKVRLWTASFQLALISLIDYIAELWRNGKFYVVHFARLYI